MPSYQDQVICITGAAGNLGQAVVRAFQSTGAHLCLVDRKPDRLPTLYPGLDGSPDHLLATSIDLQDEQAVGVLVGRIVERFGRIDVLVNTVGGYRAGQQVHQTSLAEWDAMLELNARTAFVISRAVVPTMLDQREGRIVHIASRAGLKGGSRSAAYSASKSALLRLTESLSAELKHKGIRVNCVLPGTIDTPQNREAMPEGKFERWVTPEAVADVILFLVSDAARGIHGAAIPVYGTG